MFRDGIIHVEDSTLSIANFDAIFNLYFIGKRLTWLVQRHLRELMHQVVEYVTVVSIHILSVSVFLSSLNIGHDRHCDVGRPIASSWKHFLFVDLLVVLESPGMILAIQEFLDWFAVQSAVVRLPGARSLLRLLEGGRVNVRRQWLTSTG